MEYLKPKRKKDLVNTMRMLNANNYLIYADDPNNKNHPGAYVVMKGSYSYGMEQYSYFNFEIGSVIGQYEIGDDLIIFEVEINAEELGGKKAVYYSYYSIKDEKFIKFPVKINRIYKEVANFVNLKENENDRDRFAIQMSCNGCNGIYLKHNTVDFYVGLPKFNLITDVYSTFRNKVFNTRNFKDVQKIIEQDYEDEKIFDFWCNKMNYDSRNVESELVLLKKL